MTHEIRNMRSRLRILRSDLADTNNPRVTGKYPHLDSEPLRDQLRAAIAEVETALRRLGT